MQKYGLKYCVGFKTGNDQSVFPPSSLRSPRHLQTSTGSDLLFALSCLHGLAFWLERDKKKERGRQRERAEMVKRERQSSGTCQAMSQIITHCLKIALKMTVLGGGWCRRGVGWEMHQSTCSVIKDQIKLISDNSLGEHLSRATYNKMSYLWKIRKELGGYMSI